MWRDKIPATVDNRRVNTRDINTRDKIPATVDNRNINTRNINTHASERGKATRRSEALCRNHAKLVALKRARRADRPSQTIRRNMIEHFFALHLRKLFRITHTTQQHCRLVRKNHLATQHRNTNYERPGPTTFAHFVNADNCFRTTTK